MIERFTDAAVKSITVAEDEARKLGHHSVGSAQLVLGILETDCDGSRMLSEAGVDLKGATAQLKSKTGTIDFAAARVLYGPAAKQIFRLACVYADKRQLSGVSTMDLLMGIVQSANGAGFEVLTNLGITEVVLEELIRKATRCEEKIRPTEPPSRWNMTASQLRQIIAAVEEMVAQREGPAKTKTGLAKLKQFLEMARFELRKLTNSDQDD